MKHSSKLNILFSCPGSFVPSTVILAYFFSCSWSRCYFSCSYNLGRFYCIPSFFLCWIYNRSVKSFLQRAASPVSRSLVPQLLLHQICEELSVKSSVSYLKIILFFLCALDILILLCTNTLVAPNLQQLCSQNQLKHKEHHVIFPDLQLNQLVCS